MADWSTTEPTPEVGGPIDEKGGRRFVAPSCGTTDIVTHRTYLRMPQIVHFLCTIWLLGRGLDKVIAKRSSW